MLDEKVQRSGEQLLERIREQIEPEVRRLVSELLTIAAKERATALQDDRRVADSERQKAVQEESARVRAEVEKTWAAKLREANDTADQRFESGLREAHEEADRTLALRIDQVREETERTIAAELAAAPVASAPEPAPAEPQTDEILGRVLAGMRRLDQATRLTDALDTLAELAGNEAPRAAVLTVQGDRVRGWRFVGFGPTVGEARQVDLERGEAGIVGRTVVTGEACSVVSGPNGMAGDAEPAFLPLPPGVRALAVPVLVGGQVMAVVYGDDAERRPAVAWRAALEVLARHTGHCLEALTAVRAAQLALQDAESLIPEDAKPTLSLDAAGEAEPRSTP